VVNLEWVRSFEAWLPELQEAIPPALRLVTQGRDDVVGVALFTDSDGRTLQPAALTRAHRDEIAAEYPEYAVLNAWNPDEWDLFLGPRQGSGLDTVMRKVQAFADTIDDDQWVSYTILAYNWMVEGMRNLALEGFFDAAYPDTNVAFWITDTQTDPENMVDWITLFNPTERSAPYVAYLREHGL
jgi:hypothetical protein